MAEILDYDKTEVLRKVSFEEALELATGEEMIPEAIWMQFYEIVAEQFDKLQSGQLDESPVDRALAIALIHGYVGRFSTLGTVMAESGIAFHPERAQGEVVNNRDMTVIRFSQQELAELEKMHTRNMKFIDPLDEGIFSYERSMRRSSRDSV